MALFGLELFICSVQQADPVKQLYRVLTPSNTVLTAVPAGTRSKREGTVSCTDTYSVGDLVAVCMGDMTAWGVSDTEWGIILCLVPGRVKSLEDKDENLIPRPASDYYEINEKAYEAKTAYKDQGFEEQPRMDVVSGDFIRHGKETRIHQTDRTLEIGTPNARVKLNSLDDSIKQQSICRVDETAGTKDSVKIVNESVLSTKAVKGGLNNRPANMFTEQTGDIPYGNIRTVFDYAGTPISQVEQRADGSVVIKAATGIIMERTVDISTATDKYDSLLNYDETIKDPSQDTAKPFGRAGKNWSTSKRNLQNDVTLAEPVAPAPPPVDELKQVNVPDATGVVTKHTVLSKSTIGQYPDGSIVLRDAWGSEIRMFNGDIQISAANKITLMADRDILGIVGGVIALDAGIGIQAMSHAGNIDLASNKELNLVGKTRVSAITDADIFLYPKQDLLISADSVSVSGNCFAVTSSGDISVSGTAINAHAQYECAISTATSLTKLSVNSLDIIIEKCSVYSDVTINDKGAAVSGGSGDAKPVAGSGSLIVGGSITANQDIRTAGYVLAYADIMGRSINAVNVDPDVGVYSIRKTADVKRDIKKGDVELKQQSAKIERLAKKVKESTLTKLLKTVFDFLDAGLAIFKPAYQTKRASWSRMGGSCITIDSSNKPLYIYPGKEFWTGKTLYIPDKETDQISQKSDQAAVAGLVTTVKESMYVK